MGMLRWQMTRRRLALLLCALLIAWRVGMHLPGWLALNQGLTAWRGADLQRAAAVLQTAVRRLPVSGAAWRGLGRVQLAQAQPADAQTSLQQALDHLPGDSLTHLELARTLARLGQDEQALAHFRAAGWPAYMSLRRQAEAALSQGATGDALKLAGQAAALEPTRAEAFYLWGEALWAQGEQPAAVTQWQAGSALATRPPTAIDYYYTGRVALALADPAAAVTALETSWRLDPTLPFTGLWLGEALLAAGQREAAIETWRTQARRFPDNPWAARRLGEVGSGK